MTIMFFAWLFGALSFVWTGLTMKTHGTTNWRSLWGQLRYGDRWIPEKGWWGEVGAIALGAFFWPVFLIALGLVGLAVFAHERQKDSG